MASDASKCKSNSSNATAADGSTAAKRRGRPASYRLATRSGRPPSGCTVIR